MCTPISLFSSWLARRLASVCLLLLTLMLATQALATPPSIISPASGTALSSVAVGQSMSITITAVKGTNDPYTWAECDNADPNYGLSYNPPCVPPGLTLDDSPGGLTTTLHGTPTTPGNYTFAISLLDDFSEVGVATYTLVVTGGATPTLTQITPPAGSTAGGTTVTLTGTNLTGATAVSFGGTAASSFTVNNATTITATTPVHAAGAVNVVATTSNGTATLTNGYTYALPAPTAGAVSATVAANSSANPITLSLGGGAATSVTVSSAASHGTATASGTSITYTPTAGYSGPDSFTYTATNASGTSSPGMVSITVSAPTLVLSPASGALAGGSTGSAYSHTISASGGTAPYSYAITAGSLPAGLSLNTANGVISGTPSGSGSSNFTVTATDANNATGSNAYSITISGLAPTAGAVSATVAANSSANPITLSLGGGAATSVTVSSAASHGTATASGTSITYTPTAGYSGPDSFTYTATNASGTSSPGMVSITVTPSLPVVGDVTITVPVNSVNYLIPVNLSGGVANSVAVTTAPGHGTVMVSGTSIRYTPTAGYSGGDSFTYTATNAAGTSPPARVSISMTRPDPSKNADVAGLIGAQADVAKRFTRAQITNFQSRLEWLHRRLDNAGSRVSMLEQAVPVALPGQQQARAVTTSHVPANGFAPFTDAGSVTSQTTGIGFARAERVSARQQAPSFNIGGKTNNFGDTGLDVWSAGVINIGHDKESDLRFTTSGISFGADQRLNDELVLGMGVGFGHERQTIGNGGSRSSANDYSLSVYGTYQPLPAVFIDGVIGVGLMNIDMRRYVPEVGSEAQASRTGRQWFASLSGAYEFQHEHFILSPYGRVDVALTQLDAVTESGADIHNLAYFSQRVPMTKVALGLRGESTVVLDSFTMRPYFRLEYQRDLESPGAARMAYADDMSGAVYQILATGVARNSLVFGLGSDFLFRRVWIVSGRYQYTNNSGAMTMHTFGLEVRRSF